MSDQDKDDLMKTAMIEFGLSFARYIKEMDPSLWQKAVDYAKDNTDVEGVSFHYPHEENMPEWKVEYQSDGDEDADWYNEWFSKKGPSDE